MLTTEQILESAKFTAQVGGEADCRRESLVPRRKVRAMARQLFPIHPEDRRTIKDCPDVILFKHIAPHEAQAYKNHSQSLERLAQRGGLGLKELWAVMHDVGYFDTFGTGRTDKKGAPTLDECLSFVLTLTSPAQPSTITDGEAASQGVESPSPASQT